MRDVPELSLAWQALQNRDRLRWSRCLSRPAFQNGTATVIDDGASSQQDAGQPRARVCLIENGSAQEAWATSRLSSGLVAAAALLGQHSLTAAGFLRNARQACIQGIFRRA
jgi:hypothetical protein